MPGVLQSWPAWPEFDQPDKTTTGPDFAKAKQEVIQQYGEEAIRQSWLQVCSNLKAVTERLIADGTASFPVLEMSEVEQNSGLTEARTAEIKAAGCCIVRSVLPEEDATKHFANMRQFVQDNKDTIQGWPKEAPSMLRMFNSPTQVAIRTHPNQITLQRALNSLYHDNSGEMSAEPLSYTDAARIRPPGQEFLGLGPHIDAGSLARWADKGYRDAYSAILSGTPEKYDAYDLSQRRLANQFLFPSTAHSVVFRAFQGWTALTPASPSCGTLLLYPHVENTIAYVLLRPFFQPPLNEDDVLDASKWTFDGSSEFFPGSCPIQSQRLSPKAHPHLRLKECMMHIPKMNPGDTVWWHTDMCHAVDPVHEGEGDASVVYIAACPSTAKNKAYVKTQLEAALAGKPPPDAPGLEIDETKLKGYNGYDGVSEEGKAVLGFGLLGAA
ncbi:DUF1479-domain-containing protein [Sarocladium strictum]